MKKDIEKFIRDIVKVLDTFKVEGTKDEKVEKVYKLVCIRLQSILLKAKLEG